MQVGGVEGGRLVGRWEFRTAGGEWSRNETSSARVMDGVANEYSVSRVGGGYVLISHDTSEMLSSRIVASYSCTPYGRFVGKTVVATTPGGKGDGCTCNA